MRTTRQFVFIYTRDQKSRSNLGGGYSAASNHRHEFPIRGWKPRVNPRRIHMPKNALSNLKVAS